ncbi:MAG: sugar phosphate nucleotidyltransferase [candidate division KSB1 bacterium]|nr:sugar phosphate nucleotidyltransferase [candidate division KSB1 bacterium]MDZ7341199.1 sugar phosphate nucleotidyltransferase [candidate division KSB1 bacterium]
MQAVILAGGKGTRLKPYTTILPKPLMPINDKPILEIVIRQLKKFGFDQIIIAVGHLAELIEAYFGDGSKWGVQISYSREDKPLGTAGPLTLIPNLADTFLMMNGDILTDLNYAELMRFHKDYNGQISIATYNKEVKIDLGILKVNEQHEIYEYIEKPTLVYQVSMGIYIIEKRLLQLIPRGEYFDLPDLIKLSFKHQLKVLSYPFSKYWRDIGRKEDYELALEECERFKIDSIA